MTWSQLDQGNADEVIAEQIRRFAELSRPWEWKHSYDQPANLPDRLLAAGFTAQPVETVLVAEIADLDLDVPAPSGVQLSPVVDKQSVETLVGVHDEVFGGDHSGLGSSLLAGLQRRPSTAAAVVAWAEAAPSPPGEWSSTPAPSSPVCGAAAR